jgi:hypothetical protein
MSNTSIVNPKGGKLLGGGEEDCASTVVAGRYSPGGGWGGGVEPPVGGGTPSRDLAGSCLPSFSASAASYTVVPDLLFILPAEKDVLWIWRLKVC